MSMKLMGASGGAELPVGYIFEFDPTGITGAPDLSTAAKVHNYFGYGTWEVYGAGRVTIGVSGSHAIGSEGGEEAHTLTEDETARHRHEGLEWASCENVGLNVGTDATIRLSFTSGNCTNGFRTAFAGGNQPHNNMQPYRTVYRWRRIA